MKSAFQCTTNTLQLSVSTYLLKYALSLSRRQAEKKNKNLKSRQNFRLKKMQVQTVVQSLEFFFSSQPFMARRRSEQKARESIASFSFFPPGPLL